MKSPNSFQLRPQISGQIWRFETVGNIFKAIWTTSVAIIWLAFTATALGVVITRSQKVVESCPSRTVLRSVWDKIIVPMYGAVGKERVKALQVERMLSCLAVSMVSRVTDHLACPLNAYLSPRRVDSCQRNWWLCSDWVGATWICWDSQKCFPKECICNFWVCFYSPCVISGSVNREM